MAPSLLSEHILQEMQVAGNIILAGPDDSFDPVDVRNSEVLFSNPGLVGCVSSRLCIYSAGVHSVVYGTVPYKEPLKSSPLLTKILI